MAIGAVAAFLLAGPLTSLYKTHAVASRPQPSASGTIDPHPSPTSCPASLPIPGHDFTVIAGPVPALPTAIWVNDPLGVNLRSAPSAGGALVVTLVQGTQGNADGRATDASGKIWFHVTTGNRSGWLRSDFVVTNSIHAANGAGWSLMLPQDYQFGNGSDPAVSAAAKAGDPIPFLVVQTTTASTLTIQLPAALRPDIAPVGDQAKTIQVWNYTVVKHTSRVALDTCKVVSAWARPDQGWPYMTTVFVHAPQRNYQFTLFTSARDDLVVDQVLNSIALS
jgi:hypothetical protein